MNNSVSVAYPSGGTDNLNVSYSIERTDDVQTINCCVEAKNYPIWLQLRKFSISAVEKSGNYTTLFSEVNNSKNLDTSLFIDMVYSSIMKLEHFKYS